jgi:hypothetical protein
VAIASSATRQKTAATNKNSAIGIIVAIFHDGPPNTVSSGYAMYEFYFFCKNTLFIFLKINFFFWNHLSSPKFCTNLS